MITAALDKYARKIAKECGTDSGEILLLIFLGAGVPKELQDDVRKFRESIG